VTGLLRAAREHTTAFADFVDTQGAWLRPWACYALLRQRHGGKPWWQWSPPERDARPEMIAALENEPACRDILALQFIFELQWQQLCTHAAQRGVRLFGDLPFYTDLDSADVWAERAVFALDEYLDGPQRRLAPHAGT
jgi:4-alpha-glucanotransferase